jgi:Spy/CpxP family protein refolding chaperone
MNERNERIRALLVLIAVFLLGCLVGGGTFYFWSASTYAARPGPFASFRRFGDRPPSMAETLKLSPDQEVKFREIMGESRRKVDEAMAANAPKLEAIRLEMHNKLLSILNEEQKKKFESFTKEFESRRPIPRRPPPF